MKTVEVKISKKSKNHSKLAKYGILISQPTPPGQNILLCIGVQEQEQKRCKKVTKKTKLLYVKLPKLSKLKISKTKLIPLKHPL